MDAFKALLKQVTGASNPLTSLTFWGVLILLGLPEALAYAGLEVGPWMDRLAPVLVVLGIRRRLQ
jgi:hypothetical protein